MANIKKWYLLVRESSFHARTAGSHLATVARLLVSLAGARKGPCYGTLNTYSAHVSRSACLPGAQVALVHYCIVSDGCVSVDYRLSAYKEQYCGRVVLLS